jgi:hypothetical protein
MYKQMAYFVGNVLSPTETQPEQHDATFAFTRAESQSLDLKGTPIRMEHHDKMEVGKICSSWTGNDGSKWVLGRINDSGFQSFFAKHAIVGNRTCNKPYYTGLSLQHTHTQYANGNTTKSPVEVSLCCDPRRSDCRIQFVSKIPTKKTPYKTVHNASKMVSAQPAQSAQSAQSEQSKPEETPQVTESPEIPTNPAEPEITEGIPSEDLMKLIVEQEKMAEAMRLELDELKKDKMAKLEQERSKNSAMAAALVDNWSKALDPNDFNDTSRHNILELAKKYPEETQDFFRVAHHASKKYADREAAVEVSAVREKETELQKSFNQVMSKQVHAASAKATQDKGHFMSALNKYRVQGSGRDLMDQVLELQQRKRRRMY